MWAVSVVAAIALAGFVFMLRFLIALLREGTPSVCYWVAPLRREPEKERYLRDLKNIYVGDDYLATETGGKHMLRGSIGEKKLCQRRVFFRSYCSRRSFCF
jgi:hypothetical protein